MDLYGNQRKIANKDTIRTPKGHDKDKRTKGHGHFVESSGHVLLLLLKPIFYININIIYIYIGIVQKRDLLFCPFRVLLSLSTKIDVSFNTIINKIQ